MLKERRDDVVAFIRAMIRAYWFLRTMPDNISVTTAVEQRLRRYSPDPDEPGRMLQFGSAEHAERMPFPIDGNAAGFEQNLRESVALGTIPEYIEPSEITRLDLAAEAFADLASREELQGDLARVRLVVDRFGY